MLINEYINQCTSQYNKKQSCELEEYCRLEGLDPLYIRSIFKRDKGRKSIRGILRSREGFFRRQRYKKDTIDYFKSSAEKPAK